MRTCKCCKKKTKDRLPFCDLCANKIIARAGIFEPGLIEDTVEALIRELKYAQTP